MSLHERLLDQMYSSLNSAETLDDGLLVAAAYQSAAQVEELIRFGANVDARNEKKETPLMLAASRPTSDDEGPAICKILLEHGADVDAQDIKRETALHMACGKENLPVIKILLKSDPDLDIRNKQGQTPLTQPLRALRRGKQAVKVVKVLIAAGADLWTMNRTGKTLMQYLCADSGALLSQLDRQTRTELLIKDCLQQHPSVESLVFHRYLRTLQFDLLQYVQDADENPLVSMLTVAVAMRRRAEKTFMIREELENLSEYFISLAKACLDLDLFDDRKTAMKVIGLEEYAAPHLALIDTQRLFIREGNIFEEGPIMVAIEHELADFFSCAVVQEAIRCVWKGMLDNWEPSQCSFLYIRQDNWECPISFQMYRQVPFFYTLVEVLFYLLTLALTLYVMLSSWNLDEFTQEETVLIWLISGYFANEAIQYYSWGSSEYFGNPWTFMDLVVIAIFGVWFVLKLFGEDYAEMAYRLLTSNAFFMLFRLLHFASMAEMFGTLVMSIMKMFNDMARFLVLYAVVLLSFMVIMYAQFPNIAGFETPERTMLSLFAISVGSYFDFTVFQGDPNEAVASVVIVIYMILACIMLLNLLIALLCDAYYNISLNNVREWCLMRAKFVAERTMVTYLPPPLNMINLFFWLLSWMLQYSPKFVRVPIQLIGNCTVLLMDVVITIGLVLPMLSLADLLILVLPFGYYSLSEVVENYVTAPWLSPTEKVMSVLKYVIFRPVFYFLFTLRECFRKTAWIQFKDMAEVKKLEVPEEARTSESEQVDEEDEDDACSIIYETIKKAISDLKAEQEEAAQAISPPQSEYEILGNRVTNLETKLEEVLFAMRRLRNTNLPSRSEADEARDS